MCRCYIRCVTPMRAFAMALAAWPCWASADGPAIPAWAPPQQASPGPAAPAVAVAPSVQPVTFVIERIVVEGVRHGSEKIVLSELLLTLGAAYTEAQLREALHRVKRLPFVVEADLSLRKGSERGRFELVVSVSQAWPLFFGGSLAVAGADDVYSDTEWFALATPQLGVRAFFGGQNEISATVTGFATSERFESSDALLDLTYRHHDLLGRHVVGTLFLRTPQTLRRGYEVGASIGVPLSRMSTLDLSVLRNDVTYEWQCTWCEPSVDVRSGTVTHRGFIGLRRDSTDDPFVPRQGMRLQSELSLAAGIGTASRPWAPFADLTPPVSPENWSYDSTSQAVGVSLAVRRYWPLSPRTSLGLGLTLNGSLDSSDTTATSGEQRLTSSVQGWSGGSLLEGELLRTLPGLSRGLTEFWWSARVTLGARVNRFELESGNIQLPYHVTETRYSDVGLTFSLAARGRWGIARLEFLWNHDLRPSYEQR